MADQGQRWATPDSTIQIKRDLLEDTSIEIEDESHLRRLKKRSRLIKGLIIFSVLGVLTLVAIALSFAQYSTASASMEPTLAINDRFVANKLSYRLGDIERGDVVLSTRREPDSSATFEVVSRIVGMPGESIEIVDGVVSSMERNSSSPMSFRVHPTRWK